MELLTELNPMQGGMLEEVLENEHIEFAKEHVSGIPTVFTHSYFGCDKYYVNPEDLPKAKDLVEEMFGESESSDE